MNIADAIADLGIDRDDDRMILVNPAGGKWAHYTLAECATKKINGDLYLASGLFKPGTVDRYHGRVEGNIDRILWLPFDFDLSDFYGWPKEEFWEMPDAALWPLVEGQQADIEEIFATIGLPIHRLDYTGYGLAAFVYLPEHEPSAIPEIRALHKQIVERINRVARSPIADAQVSDAGTRIMRLVPCHNTKGAIHRLTKTIYHREGTASEAQLRAAAGDRGTPPTRAIPKTGSVLDQVTTDTLIAAVSPHWTLGVKHELALAISGLLAKAGVPEEQTLAIVEELAASDEKPWDRAKCVHTSYEKVRSGLQVKGFTALQRILPPDLVTWLDGVAQRVFAATHPTITLGGKQSEQAKPTDKRKREFEEAPAIAFRGWIGEYADVMGPTTEAPKAFHLGVGLTTVAALIGRHVGNLYGPDPLYPNLYTLLIGRSGRTRKDSAIRRATRTVFDTHMDGSRIINHGVNIATDVGSSTKLIDILANKPNTLLYVTEFTRLMGNARRQSTETIIPTLMEAFDTPPVMQNNSMANPIQANFPYLSILAATQPDILAETMSGTDMNSGFANRWLFVCGNLADPIPLPPQLDRAVVSRLLTQVWDARNSYPDRTLLRLAPDAVERWSEWYIADFNTESPTAEEDAMRARHAVLIQKLALIYAVCDRAPMIGLDHLEAGIAAVEWMWRQVERLIPHWGRTINGQIEERIKAVLKRDGVLRRRVLQQQCTSRKWSGSEFARVLDEMAKNGTVLIDPAGDVFLGGD